MVLLLRHALGYDAMWGASASTASESLAAWVEWALLRRWLATRLGGVPSAQKLALGALASAPWQRRWDAPPPDCGRIGCPAWLAALAAIATFGAIYPGTMALAGVPRSPRCSAACSALGSNEAPTKSEALPAAGRYRADCKVCGPGAQDPIARTVRDADAVDP